MEWPKFDFAKYSYTQRHRLRSAGKSNRGLRKDSPKVCRSLAVSFKNVKSMKKENSTKRNTVQNESISSVCSQRGSSQMYKKINIKRIPPLSPVLVNGFLKNPAAHSLIPLKDSGSNIKEISTSSRCTDSVNPVVASAGSITLESPELIFVPPYSKQLLLSDGNLMSSLQRSKVIPRNQNFASQSQNSISFVAVAKESDNLYSKYKKNYKKPSYNRKFHVSMSTASINSLKSLETLPLSQIDHEDLNRNEDFPDLDFVNSSLSFESYKSITMQRSRSNNNVFQNHIICIDGSENVATTSEQSYDCFLDITIHETEPNDLIFETKETNDLAFVVQSTSSLVGSQSRIDDAHDKNDETAYQKQYHRLSKLAEIMRKRLFIGSSDLVMWKCEEPKQHPARRVTVISSVEQWGFCWTLVRNINDSRTAHIVDSEPMKKATDMLSRKRSQKRRNADDGKEDHYCHDSSGQTSESTFFFYQPLSKLNTPSGEFVLSPRYYR